MNMLTGYDVPVAILFGMRLAVCVTFELPFCHKVLAKLYIFSVPRSPGCNLFLCLVQPPAWPSPFFPLAASLGSSASLCWVSPSAPGPAVEVIHTNDQILTQSEVFWSCLSQWLNSKVYIMNNLPPQCAADSVGLEPSLLSLLSRPLWNLQAEGWAGRPALGSDAVQLVHDPFGLSGYLNRPLDPQRCVHSCEIAPVGSASPSMMLRFQSNIKRIRRHRLLPMRQNKKVIWDAVLVIWCHGHIGMIYELNANLI